MFYLFVTVTIGLRSRRLLYSNRGACDYFGNTACRTNVFSSSKSKSLSPLNRSTIRFILKSNTLDSYVFYDAARRNYFTYRYDNEYSMVNRVVLSSGIPAIDRIISILLNDSYPTKQSLS